MINALTAVEHPCQALADVLTIRDRLGGLDGVRVAWVGDGTNVLVSLARARRASSAWSSSPPAPRATSRRKGPVRRSSATRARRRAAPTCSSPTSGSRSGRTQSGAQRLRDLEPYRLDDALLALAAPDAIVLHCLPAHPGEEITAEALYGARSAVWDEAENRLHVQKALLALLLG